jgi:hypothetical protein
VALHPVWRKKRYFVNQAFTINMCLTYKHASRIFIRLLDEVESRGQRLTVPASGNWSANASRAQGLNARKACRV